MKNSATGASQYSIRPIPMVRMHQPKTVYTYLMNWDQQVTSANGLWFIEGSSTRILVDAGRASLTASFSHTKLEPVQSLEEGLGKLGLEPADIELIILTHLHYDHVELAYKYPRAKFIVQKAELDFALNPRGAISRAVYRKELFQGLNLEVVEGDDEIISGVKVLLTPGHTPGGQSVAINTREGLAVITGFCCINENFEPPEEIRKTMPIITPAIHLNVLELEESMLKLKEISNIIVPIHDAGFFDKDTIPGP